MVDSRVYPGLERKPGVQNWVDAAGGLDPYLERIAKHLHYEKGMSISRAIAVAWNTIRRWARMGRVLKHGMVNNQHVTAATVAKAQKAVANMELKRKAGSLALSEDFWAAIDLTEVSEEYALFLAEELLDDDGDVIDLADAEISKSDTTVALMIPPKVAKKIAVDGGVPPEDLHMTLTFHGETTPEQYQQICNDLTAWAADGGPGELKGEIGGLGQFPDKGNGVPHYAPVDVPGVNALHEQVRAVTEKTASASKDHGYTPHMTLTMGGNVPSPVPATKVKFSSMHVVRGNQERTEIPLRNDTRGRSKGGARKLPYGTLRAGGVKLSEGDMDIQILAERANRVKDPVARATARRMVIDLAVSPSAEQRRQYGMADGSYPVWNRASLKSAIGLARTPSQRRHIIRAARRLGLSSMIPSKWSLSLAETAMEGIFDLASTIAPRSPSGLATDGRRRYKRQGKWGHGFVPLDQAAKESKAKGSPIRVKSLNRIFGKNSQGGTGAYSKAATGRAGQRHAGSKVNPDAIKITEGKSGSEGASSVGFLERSQKAQETNRSARKVGSNFKEASKQTRIPERARQNWDEIPANLKTLRNGKRYVLAEYAGGQYITEWVGGVQGVSGSSLDKRKVYATLSRQTAMALTPAQLRDIINNPKTPDSVKKVARKAIKDLAKEKARA